MIYDIYFHDDFDGRASAAVMLAFFRSRGDRVARFIPVDYSMKREFFRKDFLTKPNSLGGGRNPAVLLDFAYHPVAAWWFDHHETAFLKKTWKRRFKSDPQHRWNPTRPSCCGFVLDSLDKDFDWKPPRHFRGLARWLDIIDGANFKSASQAISLAAPAMQINEFIDRAKGTSRASHWLIRLLAEKPLARVARDPRIRRFTRHTLRERVNALAYYRSRLESQGAITFIDLTGHERLELRFAPYYLYPRSKYHLSLKRYPDGTPYISVSANFMQRRANKVHLGEFLRKRYGGGGHHDAAGAEFRSWKEAVRTVRKIIERFRRS